VDQLRPDHLDSRLKLVAAVRRPEAARTFEERGIEARLIDLDAAETRGLAPMASAMRGVDRVFLLTGYDVKMLAQSKAAVDAAKAADVSHVVHLGVHASDDTTVVHFVWHQLVEAYIERSGLGYTHLHPTTFMQNILAPGGPGGAPPGVLVHYVGDARPGWIDTADIAAVAAAVLREPDAHTGQTYPLSTEAASPAEVAALIADVTGLPWRFEQRTPESFFETMVAAGFDPVYIACVRNVFERTRDGSLPELSETFDTVERLTGRPATSLRAFVERHRATFSYPAGGPASGGHRGEA
jgi:uncharacterized protein YbjT (DUF2867 family)